MDAWVQGIGLAITATGVAMLTVSIVMIVRWSLRNSARDADDHDIRKRRA